MTKIIHYFQQFTLHVTEGKGLHIQTTQLIPITTQQLQEILNAADRLPKRQKNSCQRMMLHQNFVHNVPAERCREGQEQHKRKQKKTAVMVETSHTQIHQHCICC